MSRSAVELGGGKSLNKESMIALSLLDVVVVVVFDEVDAAA